MLKKLFFPSKTSSPVDHKFCFTMRGKYLCMPFYTQCSGGFYWVQMNHRRISSMRWASCMNMSVVQHSALELQVQQTFLIRLHQSQHVLYIILQLSSGCFRKSNVDVLRKSRSKKCHLLGGLEIGFFILTPSFPWKQRGNRKRNRRKFDSVRFGTFHFCL